MGTTATPMLCKLIILTWISTSQRSNPSCSRSALRRTGYEFLAGVAENCPAEIPYFLRLGGAIRGVCGF